MTAAEWFERTFGAPLPIPPELPLVQTPGATCWTSAPALGPQALMVPAFPDEPPRYTVIGHWGHGIGSQAFYFVRRDARHRCFLRIAFGGAFDDADAREVVGALAAYRDLLALALPTSEVVYSLGTGHASFERADGSTDTFDTWQATAGVGAPAPTADAFVGYALRRARA